MSEKEKVKVCRRCLTPMRNGKCPVHGEYESEYVKIVRYKKEG